MPVSPEAAKIRASIAGITSKRGPDDPEIPRLKSELEATVLAQHIEKALSAAPPLSNEQRRRLADLLKPVRIHRDARKAAVASALESLDKEGPHAS